MTDQEREEFEFRLRLEQEAEAQKGVSDKIEEYTGVDTSSPLFGGVTGAIAAIPAGKVISGMTRAATEPLPAPGRGMPGTGTSGEKWARNWAGMNKPGTTVPEAAAAYQRAKGHGPVTEKLTQRFGPGAKLDIGSYTQAQRARPMAERIGSAVPESVRRAGHVASGGLSSLSPWIGRGLAGFGAGYQGVDAVNRAKQGDYLGSFISGVGSAGSAASLVPHPIVRGLGTAAAVSAPVLNEILDRARRSSGEPPTSTMGAEGFASGGLAYMAGGRKAAVKESASIAKQLIGKSPKPSVMGTMLETKTPPMVRPSGEGPLLPKVDNPYIAELPDVLPQKRLTRGTNPRMERLQNDPRAYDAIENAIRHGERIDPKLAHWYGTNRLLTGMLNEGSTYQDFERMMKHMASASQRNPVPQQNKMGSLLNYYDVTGQLGEPGSKLILPKGYGSLAQKDIVKRAQEIGAGEYPFDDAIKLGKFYKSYLGYHPENAVIDVIGTRVPTMATRDPEWLVNRLKVGNPREGYQIISPRGMYEKGELTMEEALKRPGFWEAAPSKVGEYAGIEDMWKDAAKRSSYKSGEGQALGWYGSAGLDDVAGLKSKPMTWEESIEQNARERARQTGQHPLDVMSDFLRLKGHLKKGGLV